MRVCLLILAFCVALDCRSHAADLPVEQPIMTEPRGTYDWTGIYAGLQAGYGWGGTEFTGVDTEVPADFQSFTVNTDPSGFIGGGHAGALYQFNNIVIGIEGDVEYNGTNGSGTVPFLARNGTLIGQVAVDVESVLSASVRGRLGYAFGRILLYGTGGYAYSSIDFTSTGTDLAGNTQSSTFEKGFNGWSAGGGVDAFLTRNISAGVEFRYTSLEKGSFALERAAAILDSDFHAVRARVGFHF